MRVHSFILLLGVAIAAVGCAPRPVAYAPYPSAGIDNVVYGGSERYALAPSAPAKNIPDLYALTLRASII